MDRIYLLRIQSGIGKEENMVKEKTKTGNENWWNTEQLDVAHH